VVARMHDVTIPKDLIERVERRRGRRHLYETLVPGRTALVVIDMQNAFVAEGAPLEAPEARTIVPNINRLAEAVRAAGGTVVWVQLTVERDGPHAFPFYYRWFFLPENAEAHIDSLSAGKLLHALYPALDRRETDLTVRKYRFSAMLPGASDLAETLRSRGIDTMLIAGTLTNVCCESTARDAMMQSFRVIMVEDANAALTDAEHLAGLTTIFPYFGDVRVTDEVIGLLARADRGAASATPAA
jgi:ureidoacrylate peracid hydrolase